MFVLKSIDLSGGRQFCVDEKGWKTEPLGLKDWENAFSEWVFAGVLCNENWLSVFLGET